MIRVHLPAHLRALHARVRALGLPIPPTLQSAYEQAVGNRGGGTGTTLLLILLVIVIVAGVTWFVRHRTLATPAHGAAASQPVGIMQPPTR